MHALRTYFFLLFFFFLLIVTCSPVIVSIAFGFFRKNRSISFNEHLIPFLKKSSSCLRTFFDRSIPGEDIFIMWNSTNPSLSVGFPFALPAPDSSVFSCSEILCNSAKTSLYAFCNRKWLLKCAASSCPNITEKRGRDSKIQGNAVVISIRLTVSWNTVIIRSASSDWRVFRLGSSILQGSITLLRLASGWGECLPFNHTSECLGLSIGAILFVCNSFISFSQVENDKTMHRLWRI